MVDGIVGLYGHSGVCSSIDYGSAAWKVLAVGEIEVD